MKLITIKDAKTTEQRKEDFYLNHEKFMPLINHFQYL